MKRIKTKINGKDAEIIYSPEMDKLRDKLYSPNETKLEPQILKEWKKDFGDDFKLWSELGWWMEKYNSLEEKHKTEIENLEIEHQKEMEITVKLEEARVRKEL